MNVSDYLDEVRAKYSSGQATEHSYRPALEKLFRSIDPSLEVINEPRRVDVGAPDFVFNRNAISIGWAEAKDVDKDIRKLKDYSKEQKERYRKGLPNLIYTNGIDFEFLRDGEAVNFISIADLLPTLPAKPDKFDELIRNMQSFAQATPVSIRSASRLASLMAGKAAIIKDVMANLLDEDTDLRSPLGGQFKAFRADLLPDLKRSDFADIYAETITYGMFAARLHDTTLNTFSRAEALDLLPRSNPFLRSLFVYIAGHDLDDRIRWIIDDLAEILRASDPALLFKDFGNFTARNDPFVHFYENFLAEYNPAKRKSRGVWYTPEPVVDFIVRAVDDLLKGEFQLPDGLADTSKIVVDYDTGQTHPRSGKPITNKKEMHRVQILDPATGTGTFLSKAIQTIAMRVKARAPGKWSGYVEQDLIKRLHGFELLMASYAMCHMKLYMMLRETGYQPSADPPRLSVWLTNALEPGEREVRDLFFTALANEARGASEVKRNLPIMCVIGNPPYSGESVNTGPWITDLMEAYKKEPGGKAPLDERNPKWINDDYVKFIRLAESAIAKNGAGVLGFITNHGYLSNPTFRGMRWHMLKSFDVIYVIDLHGSSNRKEMVPDGVNDKNVFDIKVGVSIIIAGKGGKTKSSGEAKVYHSDLWGTRDSKSASLFASSLESINWTEIKPELPHLMFVPWDYQAERAFRKGFALDELMPTNSNGIVTGKDSSFIANNPGDLTAADNSRDASLIQPITYRPFEQSYIYFDPSKLERSRTDVMEHYIAAPNVGLLTTKAFRDVNFAHVFLTTKPSEAIFLSPTTGSNAMNFPLYLHAKKGGIGEAVPNLTLAIWKRISKTACKKNGDQLTPDQVLNYIYGVLHAPSYRSKFRQALTIDYPHIPYPKDPESFERIAEKGDELRRLHLMEAAAIGDPAFPYCGDGNDIVGNSYPQLRGNSIYINSDQYFSDVPEVVWDFYLGGYQPAKKWLKDRRGEVLTWDNIVHYQKIIKIIEQTDRIMDEIDLPLD